MGLRHDPAAAQIKPVGMPTGHDGDVSLGSARSVIPTGLLKPLHPFVDGEEGVAKFAGQFCRSGVMQGVVVLVETTGIMKDRKQLHHVAASPGVVGQLAAGLKNSSPVSQTMNSGLRQPILPHNPAHKSLADGHPLDSADISERLLGQLDLAREQPR